MESSTKRFSAGNLLRNIGKFFCGFVNSFAPAFYGFKQDEIQKLEKYMSDCMTFLQLSILKTKIEKTNLGSFNYSPVSSDEKVLKALEIIRPKF